MFEYKIDGVRTDTAEMILVFQRCSISKATTRSMEYTSTALDCQFWPLLISSTALRLHNYEPDGFTTDIAEILLLLQWRSAPKSVTISMEDTYMPLVC